MYKIVCLIIKYVKLAIYNEILAFCKEERGKAQTGIELTDSDMQKNFYGGRIRAYSDIAYVLQERVRTLKEGGTKDAR